MSLSIEGISVPSVSFASISRTLLSAGLVSRLPPPRSNGYLITVFTGPYGAYSFPLHCSVVSSSSHDIVLGYDWAANLRDSMLYAGFRLDSQFNPWAFFFSHVRPPTQSTAGPSPGSVIGDSTPVPVFLPLLNLLTLAPASSTPPVHGDRVGIPKLINSATASAAFPARVGSPRAVKTPKRSPICHASSAVPTHVDTCSETETETETEPEPEPEPVLVNCGLLAARDNSLSAARQPHYRVSVSSSQPRESVWVKTPDPADVLSIYLLSPHSNLNIFTMDHSALTHVSSKCACQTLGSAYESPRWSHSTLPNSSLSVVAKALDQREAIVSAHSDQTPSLTVFNKIHALPHGSLLALARSHGLDLGHGRITLCPLLNAKPLRRLLALHDVPHSEDDNVKKLRLRLKAFLRCLRAAKNSPASIANSAKAARARESTRLREQWPQLVPESLKQCLLNNFGLRISSSKLRTFNCGSCSEACPIADRATIRMASFNLNLLSQPDIAGTLDETRYASDSCSTTTCESDSEPENDNRLSPPLLHLCTPAPVTLRSRYSHTPDPDPRTDPGPTGTLQNFGGLLFYALVTLLIHI
ncbi:hypothetical protein DFH09DRAFT_1080113 [Mycena vulgaris]|nr:hypothetical protein DFH09DRAFT_1080113 [Mycena vulgaris]